MNLNQCTFENNAVKTWKYPVGCILVGLWLMIVCVFGVQRDKWTLASLKWLHFLFAHP